MPKTPTIAEIIAEIEAEIARAPRFASVDRTLLQRLIDDHRRLEERCAQLDKKAGPVTITEHMLRENPGPSPSDVAAQRLGERT